VLVFDVEVASSSVRRANRCFAVFCGVPVQNKIAGDGKEPGFKFPFAVVLVAAFEDAEQVS